MGTTANYSWPTPVATDLVKDGWEAIKDLGDAADTTVKAVADAQGLVHINTTNFSAVSSVSVNDVFTSTYSNYRIILTNGTCASTSGSTDLTMRLRVGGSDNTSANYGTSRHAYANSLSVGVGLVSATSFTLNNATAPSEFFAIVDVFNPEETQKTGIAGQSMFNQSGTIVGGNNSGLMTVTTSYTGFTFAISTGNFSGNALVFGYKK